MNSSPFRLAALAALACALPVPFAAAGDPTTDVWSHLAPEHAPPAPLGGAVVENNAHGLILILGAPSVPWTQSVYRFDGKDWTRLLEPPLVTVPADLPKATRFAAAGDTGRNRSMLFGGVVNGEFSNRTITFDGATFRLHGFDIERGIVQATPPPRADAALAYFALADRMVLTGGVNSDGLLGDTWFFDGEGWFPYTGAHPSPRSGHAMAYDPQREVIILYGGNTADGPSNETWLFNGETWTRYFLPGPSPRAGHAMFFDEGRQRVVLVGGLPQDQGVHVAQTWEWTGTNWRIIESEGPTPRIGAKAAYDSTRGVGVLFGGVSPQATLLNDTWQLQLESPFDVVVETPAGLRPTDVTTGLFNEDAFPDALVTDAETASVFVFPNRGLAGVPRGATQGDWLGFDAPAELPASGSPGEVKSADLNGDGKQDIIVAIPGGGGGEDPGSEYFLGDGQGGFSSPNTLASDFGQDDIEPGDLDNVKDLGAPAFIDFAYVSTSSQLVGVIEGNATGFDPPIVLESGGEPTKVALGDVNLDGLPDIVFTDRANGTVVVVPQRAGKPSFFINDRIDFPVGLPGGEPVDLVLMDLDGDELLDVATADRVTDTVTTLLNRGAHTEGWLGFLVTDITPVGADPVSIDSANFFNTPLPDLATANAAGDTVSILRNLGDGLFADPINLSVNPGPVAVTTADLNADGLDDVLVASAPPAPPGILTAFLGAAPGPCPGDTDGDRYVGFTDLMNLLDAFGVVGIFHPADFDADGTVDFQDLNLLLTHYGVTCP